jgi:hypothetical protein
MDESPFFFSLLPQDPAFSQEKYNKPEERKLSGGLSRSLSI